MQTIDSYIGRQFGDFIAEERVGRGGMATVYRARQQSIARDVALKIIDLKLSQENNYDDFNRRFAKEVEFIASLEHIHILPVYAYGIEKDVAYLAMRLLRGGSIKDLLRQHTAMPIEITTKLFRQVAEGLAFAHSKGIIHRDIKPANVLLDDEGNAFLTDFGLAKLVNGSEGNEVTKQGVIVGTLTYMSPEHLRGERLDQRTDIYSMGIMLYEMLVGYPPFSNEIGEDMVGVVYKHLEHQPPSLQEANPNISSDVEAVVMKALAKKREDRYNDMAEFIRALNTAVGSSSTVSFPKVSATIGQSSTQTRIDIPVSTPAKPKKRRWVMAGMLGVVISILLIGAVVLSQQLQPLPDFKVTHDERIEWSQVLATKDQANLAQRRLGDSGFIAVVACNSDSEYHSTVTRETITLLKDFGLAYKTYDSQSDSYTQRLEMEKALTEGAEGFIVCPIDFNVIDQTLVEIQARKLPFIAYNIPDNEKQYEGVYTSSEGSNYEMGDIVGRATGAYINDHLDGKANVVILDFPDIASIIERADGIEEGILAIAPNATIVGRYLGGTREFGKQSVEQLLAEDTDFNVIASINDAGSIGAINALEAANIPPDEVSIFSVDAEELAVDYMKRGVYMRGTLEVGRSQTATSTVNMMVRMLAGDTVPEIIYIPLLQVLTANNLP